MKSIVALITLALIILVCVWLWNRRTKVLSVMENVSDKAESVLDAFGKKKSDCEVEKEEGETK